MEWYKTANTYDQVSIGFQHWHLDRHVGQDYWKLYAYDKNTPNWTVIGYLDYSEFEGKMYIDYVFVNPDFRRQGIGTALMNELELKAKDEEKEIVHGMMTEEGLHLYRSMQE